MVSSEQNPESSRTENIVWQPHAVSREEREEKNKHRGAIVWLTGLPGSGKSTLAHAVEQKLHHLGYQTAVLDGDNIRHGLCANLGFSIADRNENVRRVGEAAKILLELGIIVIVGLVSPIREARDKVRQSVSDGDFIEVYCNCSLTVCKSRDPKGMYAKAVSGSISEFTGVSSGYEEPLKPALVLNTGNESVAVSVASLAEVIVGKVKLPLK